MGEVVLYNPLPFLFIIPKILKSDDWELAEGLWKYFYIKIKFVESRIPYQIFLNKEQSISQFLISVAHRVAVDFYKTFSGLENTTILQASDILADLYKNYHGKRLIFLSTEIVKDLSYFYPERINPDSICHMNIGALNSLKIFPGRWQKVKIEKLLHFTGLKYSDLEHGLCEFNKWCERTEFYRQNGFLRRAGCIESVLQLYICKTLRTL